MPLSFASVLLAATQAPDLQLPDSNHLAPGYQIDIYGCVGGGPSISKPILLPPDDPQVLKNFKGNPGASDNYRAQYAEVHSNLREAVMLRRKALAVATRDTSEERKDLTIRLPLSIDLVRVGALGDARRQWELILSRRPGFDQVPGLRLLEKGQYKAGFQSLLQDPLYNNPQFEDSGAAAHLARGITYASKHQYVKAAAELRLSSHCSTNFQLPHLLAGFIAQLERNTEESNNEWIAALEGDEPSPPGTESITTAQYSALAMLSRRK